MKPNQKLKYLNEASKHLPEDFREIPYEVLNHLSKLTSKITQLPKHRYQLILPTPLKINTYSRDLPVNIPYFPRNKNHPKPENI